MHKNACGRADILPRADRKGDLTTNQSIPVSQYWPAARYPVYAAYSMRGVRWRLGSAAGLATSLFASEASSGELGPSVSLRRESAASASGRSHPDQIATTRGRSTDDWTWNRANSSHLICGIVCRFDAGAPLAQFDPCTVSLVDVRELAPGNSEMVRLVVRADYQDPDEAKAADTLHFL
jgi:hypothetical protein